MATWTKATLARAPFACALVVGLLVMCTLPGAYFRRDASGWRQTAEPASQLGAEVRDWVFEVDSATFATGSARFDGEWWFGTYFMAAMGFGQLYQRTGDERWLSAMEHSLDGLLMAPVRSFDTDAWGRDALHAIEHDGGHAAYLGYANLALSLHRTIRLESDFASFNDRITEALVVRLAATPDGLIETYPGERYPVDNAAVVASIALHDVAVGRPHGDGQPHRREVRQWLDGMSHYVDPATGLLFQSMTHAGEPLDAPRGSGTALASYFLSFADPVTAGALHEAVVRELYREHLGFGVVREYAASMTGTGDIDSGPIVLGYGVSATGFALAGFRRLDDQERFDRTMGTVSLFGIPSEGRFLSGGPLGNAILLAMTTAGAPVGAPRSSRRGRS